MSSNEEYDPEVEERKSSNSDSDSYACQEVYDPNESDSEESNDKQNQSVKKSNGGNNTTSEKVTSRELKSWKKEVAKYDAAKNINSGKPPPRSGTNPKFIERPSHLRNKVIPTEKGHLRTFTFYGRVIVGVERKKRHRIRNFLNATGREEEAKHPTLDPSSSDSDREDVKDEHLPAIDWNQAEYGKTKSLQSILHVPQIDSLVGWATHLTQDSYQGPHNPLVDVPNTPLQTSILNYIKEQTKSKRRPTKTVWKTRSFNVYPKAGPKKKWVTTPIRLDEHKAFWHYHDDDEEYRWIKDNWTPTESVELTALVQTFQKSKTTVESIPLDSSGQVALGMVIEEVLTSILMPMARQHVARCQKKDDAFDDWTLPPEEAIVLDQKETPFATNGDESFDSNFVTRWCERRQLDPVFVKKNMDIYAKLIPLSSAQSADSDRGSNQRPL